MKYTPRDLALGGLFGALAVVLPLLFHGLGIGPVFLPMYLPIVVLGGCASPRITALVGFIVPVLSGLFTGMPPLAPPIAFLMSPEAATLGWTVAVGIQKLRWPPVIAILAASLLSRLVLGFALIMIGPLFGFRPAPIPYVVGAFVTGLPGLGLQLVMAPLILKKLRASPLAENTEVTL